MFRVCNSFFALIILLLFFRCSSPNANSGGTADSLNKNEIKYPDIQLTEVFFDFGSIVQGEVVSHTFHFRNAGNGVLIVKDLIPDCGCTKPKIDKKILKPGMDGFVEVVFDSKGWHGSQYKSVTLRTNSPIRDKSVTIKANVVEPNE